jgi:hypothetical protein
MRILYPLMTRLTRLKPDDAWTLYRPVFKSGLKKKSPRPSTDDGDDDDMMIDDYDGG